MSKFCRKCVRVDRSPMNPKVWCLELECGHDFYRPGRRPKPGGGYRCEKCAAKGEPREKCIDPDYRKDPKTELFCCRCQRDSKPGEKMSLIFLRENGHVALHPADVATHAWPKDLGWQLIGADCARIVGMEWVKS